tara:strand:- start:387 stop:608 length:222 start_codon:yes stop_codon:yes gene_type:complete
MTTPNPFHVENLDSASDDELRAIIADAEDPRRDVALLMMAARRLRRLGRIAEAQRLEASTDRMIDFLPDDLRW